MANDTLTAVPGVAVGHWTDLERRTGCTVVLCEPAATAGVDVRGGAPGTRETDLLDPARLVERVHAICLAGGSAFGLAAADGVMRWLAAQGRGLDAGVAKVPIVPAAALFDMNSGDPTAYPDAESGWAACVAATTAPVPEGQVGAGTGATVSKLGGLADAVPAGLGSAAVRTPDGVHVGALAAVNALGDIVDPTTGAPLTGGGPNTRLAPPRFSSTTLVVVATEAHLTQAGCTALARSAHVGLARAIRPVHTPYDGDTVFVLSTGRARAEPVGLAETAARAVADAIVRAVARVR